ncbi:MAG: helix-turn-helix transcriptional regulator [Oscillospiraceae bacterium]|nr:helix-turn-helix transcriptional regulator [Oscillospiraceae bacterium]
MNSKSSRKRRHCENDSKVGSIIMAALDKMERNQCWLSRQVKMTNSYIYQIVKGHRRPSYVTVIAISTIIGVDKDILWNAVQEEWSEKNNGVDNS